jgi:hypothetical protein
MRSEIRIQGIEKRFSYTKSFKMSGYNFFSTLLHAAGPILSNPVTQLSESARSDFPASTIRN